MSISTALLQRSESKCELCFSESDLQVYTVPPKTGDQPDEQVVVCRLCLEKLDDPETDSDHWRCLNESMWTQVPAVQVTIYRILKKLNGIDWAMDLFSMIFLDESALEWAQSGKEAVIIHLDSNGNELAAGDTVTLIQDLNVKGANFTAKRGTAVRRIRLVPDNAEQIEGKVEGQQIVILTKYVKKSN